MMVLHDTHLENLNLIHITRRVYKKYLFYRSIMQLFVFQNFNWTVTVVCVILQQAGISPAKNRHGDPRGYSREQSGGAHALASQGFLGVVDVILQQAGIFPQNQLNQFLYQSLDLFSTEVQARQCMQWCMLQVCLLPITIPYYIT